MQAGKGLASGVASPGIGLTATAQAVCPAACTLHLANSGRHPGGCTVCCGRPSPCCCQTTPELPQNTKVSVQTALRIESLNLDALRLAFTPPLQQQMEETFPATSPKGQTRCQSAEKIIESPANPVLPPMAGHAVVAVGSLVAGGLNYTNVNAVLEVTPEKATLALFPSVGRRQRGRHPYPGRHRREPPVGPCREFSGRACLQNLLPNNLASFPWKVNSDGMS